MQLYNCIFLVCRKECYKCLTETLDYLLSTGQHHPMAPNVPLSPGPPPPNDVGRLSGAEAEKYVGLILACVLKFGNRNKEVFSIQCIMVTMGSEVFLSVKHGNHGGEMFLSV